MVAGNVVAQCERSPVVVAAVRRGDCVRSMTACVLRADAAGLDCAGGGLARVPGEDILIGGKLA
jgi:hypothetical protein